MRPVSPPTEQATTWGPCSGYSGSSTQLQGWQTDVPVHVDVPAPAADATSLALRTFTVSLLSFRAFFESAFFFMSDLHAGGRVLYELC